MVSIDNAPKAAAKGRVGLGALLPVVFTVTIFISASLLFFVQPLFAKLVLPQIGGAPAVWTTAMLFFQIVLLAGYVYAHLLTKYVKLKWQLPIHLAFWAAALSYLPLSVSSGWQYDPEASTTWQTLTLFALGVGVPFGMLSANAPLLQSWYAKTSGPSAADPYFLYGSSNLGSLIALLAFPLAAEPLFGAQDIGMGWVAIFVAFGGFLAWSGLLAIRNPLAPHHDNSHPTAKSAPETAPKAKHVMGWLLCAFVPSSLMLAITTKISTDLGSFPLIWVVPLSLYILSFVIAFTNKPLISDKALAPAAVVSFALLAILMSSYSKGLPTWGNALLFAPLLFIVACYAHRRLYNARPNSAHLTVFYITMSVGGAMGGFFNSIVAPNLFDSIHEGWITVVCAAALAMLGANRPSTRVLAYGLLLAGAALFGFNTLRDIAQGMPAYPGFLLAALTAFGVVAFIMRGMPAALCVALAGFLITDAASVRENFLFKDRSFFGAHTVYDKDGLRVYANGTTVHGYQNVTPAGTRPVPLSYYHPNSPMAQVLTQSAGIENARIGVVGLGVGSLACYATPRQSWEFYEIDHMVDRVARDPALFRFMPECAPTSVTHLGDARIVLDGQDFTFDIMILDAYSSDSIPVHLVTVEAVKMYQERLAADGQLVFHISNRYYDLSQPLARIGRTLGLRAVIRHDLPEDITTPGAQPSVVMVLSADADRIGTLLSDPRWATVTPDNKPAWTDDHAHLLSALK